MKLDSNCGTDNPGIFLCQCEVLKFFFTFMEITDSV